MLRSDIARRGRPEQAQRQLEFLAQDRQRALDAGLATGRQRPEDGPPDEDAARPERQCDGDVEPAADAAVDPDLGPTVDRRDHLGQDVDRSGHAIELAAAVIADHDAVHAVVHRQAGVLRGRGSP